LNGVAVEVAAWSEWGGFIYVSTSPRFPVVVGKGSGSWD